VSRSSSAVEQLAAPAQPVQFVEFATAEPTAVESNPPQLSTEVVVQRAVDEPPSTTGPVTTGPVITDPAAATGAPAAAGAIPGQPAGSTSPTEIDKLVRRLYDPIVRRLKAELQLDRERAGRSLDLWH
jgi:hypothetical protein